MYNQFHTDDPVWDEARYSALIEQEQASRDYMECSCCGGRIFREDKTHHGDIYYELEGVVICEDCILDYIRKFKNVYT